jgi:hypothetical protein
MLKKEIHDYLMPKEYFGDTHYSVIFFIYEDKVS